MAGTKSTTAAKGATKPRVPKPPKATRSDAEAEAAELNLRVLRAQVKTAENNLKQSERDNAKFEQDEEQRHKKNTERQADLAQIQRAKDARIAKCRHKSGGRPGNILKGGGIGSFSVISVAIMPDGVTEYLQCPRCRLGVYTPVAPDPLLKRDDPGKYAAALEEYADKLEEFNEMKEASLESGLSPMRGPTFSFKKDGVPVIPARA
jgi:hypothetical protein